MTGQAGDSEIEVTKMMAGLGVIELQDFNPELDDASAVARLVYQAMEIERRRSSLGACNPGMSDNTCPAKS